MALSRADQASLRAAASAAGAVCDALIAWAQSGALTTTADLEEVANRLLRERRAGAPFKAFEGFGFACCASLNAEIVNGPPLPARALSAGDVLSVAVGAEIRGMHGKAARTTFLGETPPPDVARLLQGTRAVFERLRAKPGPYARVGELACLVQASASAADLRVVRDSGGWGIGKRLHQPPEIPNAPPAPVADALLTPGMALVLMPMMTLGGGEVALATDGWTHVCVDGALSAHVADTLLVLPDGALENLSAIS